MVGNLMRNAARSAGHLTIKKMLDSGTKLKVYGEKAKATRLRKMQQQQQNTFSVDLLS